MILFLHGRGEAQTINNGGVITTQPITALLRSGTPPKMLYDRTTSALNKFIVVSPQSPYTYWNEDFLSYFIDHLIETYPRIDPERIYLTGLSMGGTGCWKFAEKYPEKIAAMIPIASSATYVFDCAKPELPIWSFWGELDSFRGEMGIVKSYNTSCPREIPAQISMIPGAVHSSTLWGTVYQTKLTANGYVTGLTQDTIYNWLLSHKRSMTTTVNHPPHVFASEDRTLTLPLDTVALSSSAADGDGRIVSYAWTQLSGNSVTIINANSSNALVTGFSAGTYEFMITVTDDGNSIASDRVTLTVNQPEGVLYRINCGGAMVADSLLDWSSDKQSLPVAFLDPSSSNHTSGSNTWKGANNSDAPDNVFGNHRLDLPMTGQMMFNFPVENGDYVVKLYFSTSVLEIPGLRVFNVVLEGNRVLTNFDISLAFGSSANQKNFEVSVTDGMIDLDLERIIGDPKIDAIEIRSKAVSFSSAAPLMAASENSAPYLTANPQPFAEQTTFTFIPDHDGLLTLTVKDMQGQIRAYVFSGTVNGNEPYDLPFSSIGLEEGIYIAELTTSDAVVQYRMMVTK